jgi:sulfite oxidase
MSRSQFSSREKYPGIAIPGLPVIDRRAWLLQAGLAAAGLTMLRSSARGQEASRATKQLITRQETPFNAEPPSDQLVGPWLTPWELFFVRSHGAVPQIDGSAFRVQIEGLVEKPQMFSIAELREHFPLTTMTATLTCAGNRRDEFSAEKQIAGVQWSAGAIGHAQWAGFRLSDVLKHAGLKPEAKHVQLEGRDEILDMATSSKSPFGGSITLEKALSDSTIAPGALLATHMSDRPLTAEHGAPLRLVAPGYIGARSVKWLHKIVVSDRPSPNRFIARDYKLLYEGTEDEIRSAGPILEHALSSAITVPKAGSTITGERVNVRGYALPPGRPGRQISRVEVSADDGQTWQTATLNSPRRDFSWVTWSVSVPIAGAMPTLVVRATDSSGETQPERARWNVKGYMNNGWHRVTLTRG